MVTSISIFQHPNADKRGEVYKLLKIREGTKMTTVLEYYTNIPPAYFIKENPHHPQAPIKFVFPRSWLAKAIFEKEYE